jgi:predicted transcriptional regulator of viral defense system
LAQDAETNPDEASRALSRLAQIGALIRLKPGRYAINPHVGWQGSLLKRQQSAENTPTLVVSR